MGIISSCVKCSICSDEYRIRFNVGNKYPQTAAFACDKCGETLTFGLDANERFVLTNLIQIDESRGIKVINLHPELPIDAASKNDPYYFPSMDFMMKQDKVSIEGMPMYRKAQLSCISYQNNWDAIETDFRYLVEQRWNLLKEKYGSDNIKTEKKILKTVFNIGRIFLEGPWYTIYRDVLSEAEKAKRHAESLKLKTFLSEFKDEFLLDKMYAIMLQYRKIEAELLPTLLDQKCGTKPTGLSSSINWGNIEMFYGNVYEIFGDLLIIPAVVNNAVVRNNFEHFATDGYTLQKHLETDKAGRCKNFIGNDQLIALSEFYDAGIRNGTFHKASKFDKEKQEITLKTGKGGKTERVISLITYIENCNELYARCLILFNIYYKMIN